MLFDSIGGGSLPPQATNKFLEAKPGFMAHLDRAVQEFESPPLDTDEIVTNS
jgi:hypothetical protein